MSLARALTTLVMVVGVFIAPLRARADELTPGLMTAESREKARSELKAFAPKTIGLYLAFDPSASDPIAMAACDDDGDPVIVISDAMLRLAEDVAHASSVSETKVKGLATFFAKSQKSGRRLLPPPAGFYEGTPVDDDRLRDVLSFVVARELAHHEAGDISCSHPTATKESGDDEWTADEQRAARTTAAKLYPGKATERDAEAMKKVLAAGRSREGALALVRFFAEIESASTWSPTYLAHHPQNQRRLASSAPPT